MFTGVGLLAGARSAGLVDLNPAGDGQALAESTLAVVLFADAARIDLGGL